MVQSLTLSPASPSSGAPAAANDDAPRAASKPLRRHDWAAIARLLGEGVPAERIALDLGIQPRIIRRQIRRSAKLRRLIGYFRAEAEASAAARIGALRGKVAERLDVMLAAGNPRVTLWLADRLGLTDAEAEARLPGATEADLARRAAKRAHLAAIRRQLEIFAAEEKVKPKERKPLAGEDGARSGASDALQAQPRRATDAD